MTVRERARECGETLRQCEALGFLPVLSIMQDDWPRGEVSHGRFARRILAAALRLPCTHVLLIEDDVDLSVLLPERLPALAATGEVVTLYLPGGRFYPARRDLRSGVEGYATVATVRNLGEWWASQALLLPREIAADVCEFTLLRGFDVVLRSYLRAVGRPLLAAVPNLVQHRSPPSITSRRYRPHRSITYAG